MFSSDSRRVRDFYFTIFTSGKLTESCFGLQGADVI